MKLRNIRLRAVESQQSLCFYCNLPMAASAAELQSFAREHRLSEPEARQLLATAEHLVARCDGGGNISSNIVAAHLICNMRRHRTPTPMPPDTYRNRVQIRCRQGKWHSARVLQIKPVN
jgi:hypothetical protein